MRARLRVLKNKNTAHKGRIITSLLLITGLILGLVPSTIVSAAGEATIGGGTNVTGNTDEQVSVPGIQVTSDDQDEVVPVTLSVPRGQLSMTVTTGITFEGGVQTGKKLQISGTVSDINAALDTLRYRTTRAETVELTAALTNAGEVFWPGNGHIYEIVEADEPITASEAKIAAEQRTKYGATGYLVTVTSAEENSYVGDRLEGDGWMGASDQQTEGTWQWIAGPETGLPFWQGLGDGSPIEGRYSNWADGEPNNSYPGDGEDCAQFYSGGGGWNDLSCDNHELDYYVVEYGASGDMPMVSQTSLNITTTFPDAEEVPISSCLDLIQVGEDSNDHRYDNLTLTDDIDCGGETLSPMFAEEDPDEEIGKYSFRGTFDGQGKIISNFTIDTGGENNTGFIAATNGATIKDLTLSDATVSGGECTGALVGDAVDTTIEGVETDVLVEGDSGVGGLVGCYYSETLTSNITDNIVKNNATGSYDVGGLFGQLNAVTTAGKVNISGNETSGIDSQSAHNVSGLIGDMAVEDGAEVALEENVVNGPVLAASSVGGLIGTGYSENGGKITVDSHALDVQVSAQYSYAGGIAGSATAYGQDSNTKFTIENSSFAGSVEASEYAGGLIGETNYDYGEEDVAIRNSSSSADVYSEYYGGGLAAEADGLEIVDSYATGNVTGGYTLGGLVGASEDTIINQSYATGNVAGDDNRIGGLVGANQSDSEITESYATGSVTGDSRVGGLTGANGGSVINSYARGGVTGNDDVGGLSGRCGGVVEKSYSTGLVIGGSDTGGLVGYKDNNDCEAEDSFWDIQTSEQAESAAGTGKTTGQMKNKDTFTNVNNVGLDDAWDFAAIWGMAAPVNDNYPCLQWTSDGCEGSENPNQDTDGDSVPDAIEKAAPNNGDANNDGIADFQQPDVASFVNSLNSKYTVLDVSYECTITDVAIGAETKNAVQDPGFKYPVGLMNFALDCGIDGFTADVAMYQYGIEQQDLVVRKYLPANSAYFTINDARISQTTIANQTATIANYQITDGSVLDIDGTVNGTIIDPVGFATSAAGIPNTGIGGRR